MNLWPSRGLMIRGFEVKISRSDLRREAARPEKAEEIAAFCDEWWLVTPPGLVQNVPLELPPAWGLLEAQGRGLHVVRPATATEAEPLNRRFLAAILRQAQGMVASKNEGWIRYEQIKDETDRAFERGKADGPVELLALQNKAAMLQKRLEEWRDGTGIDLAHEWRSDVPRAARCYRFGRALLGEHGYTLDALVGHFERAKEDTQTILSSLKDLAKLYEETA
jgi:hypothetical protein